MEWLETCPDFSWPMANQLREWILSWEPDLTETIRWNNLCFVGRKLIVGISACRHHLAIFLFRGTELPDPSRLFTPDDGRNTNIRSIRVTSLEGVDRKALREMLRAAVELDADPAIPPVSKSKRKPWPMPQFFRAALAKKRNRVASENFRAMSLTSRREYLVWLTTAKRPETRTRRLTETLAALAGGRKWAQRKI